MNIIYNNRDVSFVYGGEKGAEMYFKNEEITGVFEDLSKDQSLILFEAIKEVTSMQIAVSIYEKFKEKLNEL
jgi:hypothetical protein